MATLTLVEEICLPNLVFFFVLEIALPPVLSIYEQGLFSNPPWRSNFGKNFRHIVYELCDKLGHSARCCHSRPTPHFSGSPWPQSNFMAHDQFVNNSNWVMDSSASHHITLELQNLLVHSK